MELLSTGHGLDPVRERPQIKDIIVDLKARSRTSFSPRTTRRPPPTSCATGWRSSRRRIVAPWAIPQRTEDRSQPAAGAGGILKRRGDSRPPSSAGRPCRRPGLRVRATTSRPLAAKGPASTMSSSRSPGRQLTRPGWCLLRREHDATGAAEILPFFSGLIWLAVLLRAGQPAPGRQPYVWWVLISRCRVLRRRDRVLREAKERRRDRLDAARFWEYPAAKLTVLLAISLFVAVVVATIVHRLQFTTCCRWWPASCWARA